MNNTQLIYYGTMLAVFVIGFLFGIPAGRGKERKAIEEEAEKNRQQQMWDNFFNQLKGGQR